MSGKNVIYHPRNTFTNRAKEAVENFSELTAKLSTLDSALLLLGSKETEVLIGVFKHITEFVRKQDENVAVIREKKVLDLLLGKSFFKDSTNTIIKRFALYLVTAIMESVNILQDIDTNKVRDIQALCMNFYIKENDEFCVEYLSVCINKCLDDPQAALEIISHEEYLEKFFSVIARHDNPDIVLHSIEALHKMLQVQSFAVMKEIASGPFFPLERILCELTNEFLEIRNASLKVTKILIADTTETSLFTNRKNAVNVLQQLTKALCNDAMGSNASDIVDVLAAGMLTEEMTQIFFEQNLFDMIVFDLENHVLIYTLETNCQIMRIFAEAAKYTQFLPRLHKADVTVRLVKCLVMQDSPCTFVLAGLNRLMKLSDAAKAIVESFPMGIMKRLNNLIVYQLHPIKMREQAAELVSNLMEFAFHATTAELLALNFPLTLADTFAQGMKELSIDFVLSLLSIIENLAHNDGYRQVLAEATALTRHIVVLLRDSFSTSIVVTNIFRCLCTLIEEESVRLRLIQCGISASVKRGLKSLANTVKSSVTNFIMQTARFPEFIHEYIEANVLEVLLLHQKHAICVPTWNPATEAILSKCPSLKFCIRNQLGFTDSTTGNDFLVSKRKFSDFRDFQNILKEEVSPLQPILVVNFHRPRVTMDQVVRIPPTCLKPEDGSPECWTYCRNPADSALPLMLDALNKELEDQGLVENQPRMKRQIDFDNIANRAKIIASLVAKSLGFNLKPLDLNTSEECCTETVRCHLKELNENLHCNFIPIGSIRTGCQFERAVLFKALSDQIGLPCTLKRSVDGNLLYNELPLPVQIDRDIHCEKKTLELMSWRMLRPTHVVDVIFNVGALYPLQSRQALQYLRLY